MQENPEEMLRRMRAGRFRENNGVTLNTINIVNSPERYAPLRDVAILLTETAGGSASAASEIMIGALHPLTGSVYEVAVPHSLGDRDHSPFDAATHHDLLAAALTSAGPAPFGPDLVVDVVAALPTAASAASYAAPKVG